MVALSSVLSTINDQITDVCDVTHRNPIGFTDLLFAKMSAGKHIDVFFAGLRPIEGRSDRNAFE